MTDSLRIGRDRIEAEWKEGVSLADLSSSAVDLDRLRALLERSGARRPEPPRRSGAPRAPLPVGDGPYIDRPRVCIATPDIVGPVRNGGIGTAYTSLARALAAAGHDVTVLYTLGRACENETLDHWIERYREEGIDFVPLVDDDPGLTVVGPRTPWLVDRWLRARPAFDVVHAPEWQGVAAFAVQAKYLGLAHAQTTLCVGVHSPTLWHRRENGQPIDDRALLDADALERRSVARADVVVAPSQYLFRWLDDWDWELPERCYVQPYARPRVPVTAPTTREIDEIVFFGRLETRKGLDLFCDAIERLDRDGRLIGRRVRCLGKDGSVDGRSGRAYVERRATDWSVPLEVDTGRDQDGAVRSLALGRQLAVLPSRADNTPNTVLECLAAGIPFVATRVGGIPEMVRDEHATRALCPPTADGLAEAIARQLESPFCAAAAHGDDATAEAWIGWHEAEAQRARSASPPTGDERPLVSVCLATRNRPGQLRQAVESVRSQAYERWELVIVDDASDDPSVAPELDRLERTVGPDRCRSVRSTTQRFPGGARNLAAAHARGRWLLFMDDDNLARPGEIETLVAAALHVDAEVITCGYAGFTGERPGSSSETAWLPLGATLPLGLFANVLGDTNALVDREAFFAIGGFREDPGAGRFEDWALHVRLALAGFRVEAVPEPLFDYRLGAHGHGQAAPPDRAFWPVVDAVRQSLPTEIALGLGYGLGRELRGESDRLRDEVDAAHQRRLESRFVLGQPAFAARDLTIADLEIVQDVEIASGGDGVELLAVGPDPAVRLRRLRQPATGGLVVRLEWTASQPAISQLFWWSADETFDRESRSLFVASRPGRQTRYLEIPATESVTRLRFDPAMHPGGKFVLHHVEVRRPAAGGHDVEALRRRFERARPLESRPLRVASVRPMHQIESLEAADPGVTFVATGTDPHLRLGWRLPGGTRRLVAVTLDAPEATVLQLFWATWTRPWYGEDRSTTLPIQAGPNRVVIELPSTARGRLRLDPGAAPGRYRVRSVELAREG